MFKTALNKNIIHHTWKLANIVLIPKPNKDTDKGTSYRPISLLSVIAVIAGTSCTSQLLNLTQYIEDGYEKSLTTGTVFVDLSAAYDTVNHRVLLTKLYGMTEYAEFTKLIGSMMRNRRFYVELNGKKSR